ncbi:MAG: phosphodiesterase [Granulosicoccaceae bacterium]|jgi:Icc protein
MPQRNPRTVINITDCHIGGWPPHHGGDPRDILLAVLDDIQHQESPDLIIASGDLSDTGMRDDYRWLKDQLDRFNCPVLAIPGNHDDSDAIDAVFNAGRGMLNASCSFNNWRIIPLDTCLPGAESGLLSAASLYALDQQLGQHPDKPTLVTLHHPPVAIGTAWLDAMGLENADELMAVLANHPQVKLLLCGHVHQAVDMYYKDIRILISPATCRQFLPGSDAFAIDPIPPGYRRIILDESGMIDTTVKRLDEQTWLNCRHVS